jgi:hypothetical protein
MNKNNDNFFNESDRLCWEYPTRYALCKKTKEDVEYYSIFQILPVLRMKLCDDFDYALRLANKMIEHGVRVFDSFEEFYAWYKFSVLNGKEA